MSALRLLPFRSRLPSSPFLPERQRFLPGLVESIDRRLGHSSQNEKPQKHDKDESECIIISRTFSRGSTAGASNPQAEP